jgi:hypothetical protein
VNRTGPKTSNRDPSAIKDIEGQELHVGGQLDRPAALQPGQHHLAAPPHRRQRVADRLRGHRGQLQVPLGRHQGERSPSKRRGWRSSLNPCASSSGLSGRGHGHRAFERGQVLLEQAAGVHVGRVVDHDVESPPGVEDRADVRDHVLLGADVAGQRQPDPAVPLDPPHRGLGRIQPQVVARHPRPVPGQRQRDPAPDIGPGPSYQGHLSVQRHIHGSRRYMTLLTTGSA